MSLIIFFIVLNCINVILQTVKSLATINGGKMFAAIMNALAYGVYTIVLVYINNDDISLFTKTMSMAGCNFISVYIVKYFEEKLQKNKMWKIELTVSKRDRECIHQDFKRFNISHNYSIVDKWAVFNCFCLTKEESKKVKELAENWDAKYFINEAVQFRN